MKRSARRARAKRKRDWRRLMRQEGQNMLRAPLLIEFVRGNHRISDMAERLGVDEFTIRRLMESPDDLHDISDLAFSMRCGLDVELVQTGRKGPLTRPW
jgi:hypothetical protein